MWGIVSIFLGLLLIAFAFVIIIYLLSYTIHVLLLRRVDASVKSLYSGIMIEHGAVFNKETGEAIAQRKPSMTAFRLY